MNFLPSGPIFTFTISSMKPVTPSTAICQRPGTSCRFMPINMKPATSASAISSQSELLVKLMS